MLSLRLQYMTNYNKFENLLSSFRISFCSLWSFSSLYVFVCCLLFFILNTGRWPWEREGCLYDGKFKTSRSRYYRWIIYTYNKVIFILEWYRANRHNINTPLLALKSIWFIILEQGRQKEIIHLNWKIKIGMGYPEEL